MLKLTARSLWEHKRRLLSTVVAIVLGVAFMSGTLILGDTIDSTFDDLFREVNAGVDAQVQGVEQFSADFGGPDARFLLAESLVGEVAAVEGVQSAAPFVQAFGFGSNNRLIGPDGEALGVNAGPPTLLQNWVDDPDVNPYVLREGTEPAADDEVALNTGAAEEAGIAIGDTVTLAGQEGRTEYEIVGLITFGDEPSAAGAISAVFTLDEVQRLAGLADEVQTILVSIDPSADADAVRASIADILPDEAEVISGDEAASQTADDATQFVDFFQIVLLVFVAIAVVVGIFIIYNTFSILVGQRTQELALLRTLGAGRPQVFQSVVFEAAIVGLIGALVGLGAGVALATGAIALLEAVGIELPTSGLVIGGSTVLAALLIGLGVTIASAVLPAWRATRVPPLAALRDVAVDRSGTSRVRLVLGSLVLVVAMVMLAQAWLADGDSDAIPVVGLGAQLAIVGAIVIGPVVVVPSIRVLGVGVRAVGGLTGRLATENALRNPKRTSLTASALIIGVALIGFVSVFGESARASISSEFDRGFFGDLAIQSDAGGFGPPPGFSPAITEQAAAVDGVEAVSALGFFTGQLTYPDGDEAVQFITSIDPVTAVDLFEFRMEEGGIDDLTDDGVIVDVGIADDNDLAIGDEILLTGPGGAERSLTIQAVSDDLSLLGFWTITETTYRQVSPEALDVNVGIKLADGADEATVRAALDEVVADAPSVEVLTADELVDSFVERVTQILNIVSGLLLLSVIVAMIGIANTLSLSIQERTREIGLLRAVGMGREQVRSAIRWEAVLIAVLGSLVGLGLGLVLSRALVESLDTFGITDFAVPVGTLVAFTVVAALLAVLSSILPARRAARMPVLDAIATD